MGMPDMDGHIRWYERLFCWLGFHQYRYRTIIGLKGLHMVCNRCNDSKHACPYGLADKEMSNDTE